MTSGMRDGGGGFPPRLPPSAPPSAVPTLVKIEKGEPGVAIGNYAIVLFVLGMTERLADLADPKGDTVGLRLEEEQLPQRIRRPKK